jgi:hypothetical protein
MVECPGPYELWDKIEKSFGSETTISNYHKDGLHFCIKVENDVVVMTLRSDSSLLYGARIQNKVDFVDKFEYVLCTWLKSLRGNINYERDFQLYFKEKDKERR